MFGVPLSPEFARVLPRRAAMFEARSPTVGQLAGLLVAYRRTAREPWKPAVRLVSIEAVIVHGVSLQVGPSEDLIREGDMGWHLFGRVRTDQTLVVFVRNNQRHAYELSTVLVLHGDGTPGTPRGQGLRLTDGRP